MDDRLDLSPLDPATDRERFESLLYAAARDGIAARARRRPMTVALLSLTRWRGPLIAAAAVIALVASGALFLPRDREQDSVVETVGIPDEIARWAENGTQPTVAELAGALRTRARLMAGGRTQP